MGARFPRPCAKRYSSCPLRPRSLAAILFSLSLAFVLYELVLTRVFAIVMFAQFAHLAIQRLFRVLAERARAGIPAR